jgi:hypothetical protein
MQQCLMAFGQDAGAAGVVQVCVGDENVLDAAVRDTGEHQAFGHGPGREAGVHQHTRVIGANQN